MFQEGYIRLFFNDLWILNVAFSVCGTFFVLHFLRIFFRLSRIVAMSFCEPRSCSP